MEPFFRTLTHTANVIVNEALRNYDSVGIYAGALYIARFISPLALINDADAPH